MHHGLIVLTLTNYHNGKTKFDKYYLLTGALVPVIDYTGEVKEYCGN